MKKFYQITSFIFLILFFVGVYTGNGIMAIISAVLNSATMILVELKEMEEKFEKRWREWKQIIKVGKKYQME